MTEPRGRGTVYMNGLPMNSETRFFFTRDDRHRWRFFSAEPVHPPDLPRNRARKVWNAAKGKLLAVLPARTLRKEQAFDHVRSLPADAPIRVLVSGRHDLHKTGVRFDLWLARERTRHLLLLAGEALVVPISAVAAFLPGPNIFFYALALVMYVQGRGLQGIRRLARSDVDFAVSPALHDWEEAVKAGRKDDLPAALAAIERAHGLDDLGPVLRRTARRRAQKTI